MARKESMKQNRTEQINQTKRKKKLNSLLEGLQQFIQHRSIHVSKQTKGFIGVGLRSSAGVVELGVARGRLIEKEVEEESPLRGQ